MTASMSRAFARCSRPCARTANAPDTLRVVKCRPFSLLPSVFVPRRSQPANQVVSDPFFTSPLDTFVNRRGALGNVFADFDRLANRMFEDALTGNWPAGGLTFGVDVEENDKSYVVKADLPGFAKEDVTIDFKDNVLTISGEKKQEKKNDKVRRVEVDSPDSILTSVKQHVVERSFGKFSRSIRLPSDTNPEDIKATLSDGVLNVTVAKHELPPEQAAKKIEIH